VPVFEKSNRELSGTPKITWVLCDFTSENKEEKTNRHLNPNCRPLFAVCIREVSSRKPKEFFGVYRYFAGADSNEYLHGALKKIVLGWRLACILFPPFPQTLHLGSRLMVVYLVYAGVGLFLGATIPARDHVLFRKGPHDGRAAQWLLLPEASC